MHGLALAVYEDKLVILVVDNHFLETLEGLWDGLRGKDKMGIERKEKC